MENNRHQPFTFLVECSHLSRALKYENNLHLFITLDAENNCHRSIMFLGESNPCLSITHNVKILERCHCTLFKRAQYVCLPIIGRGSSVTCVTPTYYGWLLWLDRARQWPVSQWDMFSSHCWPGFVSDLSHIKLWVDPIVGPGLSVTCVILRYIRLKKLTHVLVWHILLWSSHRQMCESTSCSV